MAKAPKKSDKSASTEDATKTAKKTPAKKPESAAAAASSAPKATAKKAAEKKHPTKANSMGGGLIDSGLLASSAANFLLARAKGRHQMQPTNSASIEQIKSDLAKPASAVAGELIDQQAEGSGGRRPNLPGGHGTPHSQTVGHAAERTSVPRRTGG